MKKYYVCLPFCGSLQVKVFAKNEEEAEELGRREIESISNEDIMHSIEWEHYEVYEA